MILHKTPGNLWRSLANNLAFVFVIIAFIVAVLWKNIVITVPAGHAGVMWYRFFGGTNVGAAPLGGGIHFIFPWDHLIIYDMRLQSHDNVYEVVSSDGLALKLSVTFRWKVSRKNLALLHETVGPDYLNVLLIPEIGSNARGQVVKFTAEDFYSVHRRNIRDDVYKAIMDAENGIGRRNEGDEGSNLVSLNDVLFKDVVLPERVRDAIERKITQAQAVQEYKFRIESEKLESDRKAIEAQGIRRFQDTVTPTISNAYLTWRGIEATLKLAESQNAKVVIVGNGPGGLPVILNGFDQDRSMRQPIFDSGKVESNKSVDTK